MPQALLIYNPAAGRMPPEMLASQSAQALRENGWDMAVEPTKSAAHITQLARQAANAGLDALFVAGGDGSIGKAVAGLIGSQTALGVLPAGTANVWAMEIGLPRMKVSHPTALVASAKMLATGQVRAIDVGLCNGVPFLLWAGMGLDGLVVGQLETQRKRWKRHFVVPQYALSTLRNVVAWPEMVLKIQAQRSSMSEQPDGETCQIEGKFIVAVVSNIRHYVGGLVKISPNARLNDGVMEMWLFSGRRSKVFKHLWNLWAGKHVDGPDARRVSFNQISVEADLPVHLHVDGEPLKAGNKVDLEVRARALRVLVPESVEPMLFEEAPAARELV